MPKRPKPELAQQLTRLPLPFSTFSAFSTHVILPPLLPKADRRLQLGQQRVDRTVRVMGDRQRCEARPAGAVSSVAVRVVGVDWIEGGE